MIVLWANYYSKSQVNHMLKTLREDVNVWLSCKLDLSFTLMSLTFLYGSGC